MVCVLAWGCADPGWSVIGSATSSDGQPIVRADVTLACPNEPARRTTSDSSGKFKFAGMGDGLDPACTVTVAQDSRRQTMTLGSHCAKTNEKTGQCSEALVPVVVGK
jgi:hypothetical protein